MLSSRQGEKPYRMAANSLKSGFRLSASDFLLLRQKKVTKEKATPEVTVSALRAETALRCSSALAAAELAGRVAACSDSPRRNPGAICAARRCKRGPRKAATELAPLSVFMEQRSNRF